LGRLTGLFGMLAACSLARSVAAQGPRLPRPFETERFTLAPPYLETAWPATAPKGDSVVATPTHWAVGAVVGATVVGVLGALAAHDLCADNPNVKCVLGGGVVGGVIGLVIGGLIGGLFPKSP